TKGIERAELVRKLRQDERERLQEWRLAVRFWKDLEEGKPFPVRFTDLEPRDREGVTEYLMPFLSKEEKKRLKQSEGKWPQYAKLLVEIADRHPLALPGSEGPKTFKELPHAVKGLFNQ